MWETNHHEFSTIWRAGDTCKKKRMFFTWKPCGVNTYLFYRNWIGKQHNFLKFKKKLHFQANNFLSIRYLLGSVLKTITVYDQIQTKVCRKFTNESEFHFSIKLQTAVCIRGGGFNKELDFKRGIELDFIVFFTKNQKVIGKKPPISSQKVTNYNAIQ